MHNHKKEESNKTHREHTENLFVRLPPLNPLQLWLVISNSPREIMSRMRSMNPLKKPYQNPLPLRLTAKTVENHGKW